MARRKKSSPLEDVMDLVALLPWWAGVGLALVSYWVLHSVAAAPPTVVKTGTDLLGFATDSIWRGLAMVGQFLLPLVCLLGALVSYLGRRKRQALLNDVTASTAADALEGMTWREFELLVGEGFRRQGYGVAETGGGGADGGVDLVLTRSGEKTLVQCKQWKAFKVGVTVVRELYGVMAAQGAVGGFVVTSGRFTDEATAFASGRNIRLLDGPALLQLIRRDKAAPTSHRRSAAADSVSQTAPAPMAAPTAPTSSVESAPRCPLCAQVMSRRVAKRGASAGNAFWGCSGYPQCKGTRPI
jgi:restriction system protein